MKFRQKLELTLALALISACGAMTGCSSMTPAQSAQYDRIKCEVVALEPLALHDADYAVSEIEKGGLTLDLVVTVGTEVKTNRDAVKAAFSECRAKYPKPTANADAGVTL